MIQATSSSNANQMKIQTVGFHWEMLTQRSTPLRRSEGLLKFAETYRNLNKITTLNLKKIFIRDLFENLHQLMQPTLEKKNIELIKRYEKYAEEYGDEYGR